VTHHVLQLLSLAILISCAQLNQPNSAFSAELLLQWETALLLNLAVLQLTASIPDSYPGAQAVRDHACLFAGCDPLIGQ
jgi:hypothetical protein